MPLLLSRPLTLAVLGCALLVGSCDRQSGDKAQPKADAAQQSAQPGVVDRSHKGAPLPEITVSDAAGEELDLRTLKGKPVLINLWATWCAPCVAELPTLQDLASRDELDIEVVTISQDAGEPEKVEAFLDQRGLAQLPAWLDPKSNVSFHYGAGMLPTSILYDAGGREVWRYAGDKDWTSEATIKLLAEAGITRE